MNTMTATTPAIGGTEPAMTAKKTAVPAWVSAFWKEIDNKTWGEGFNCLAEDAEGRLGVAQWNGREAIRTGLRDFIDKGFTAHHEVTDYWDGGAVKMFCGVVTMTPDDASKPVVKPSMAHFFYMDEANPTQVRRWVGAVGPTEF